MTQEMKKDQHYVFQAYLCAWKDKYDKVWSLLRRERWIHSKTDKIAFAKYFYKIKPINEDELSFLQQILPLNSEDVKKQFLDHIALYQEPLVLEKVIKEINKCIQTVHGDRLPDELKQSMKDLEEKAKIGITNVVEDYHADFEGAGMKWIESLKKKDTSFYYKDISEDIHYTTDDEKLDFLFFLCTQYFRTKAMKERWVSGLAAKIDTASTQGFHKGNINVESLVYPTFWLFSNNVAYALKKSDAHMTVLENNTEIPFITCDQPVINIAADYYNLNEETIDLVFYYPISSRIAITVNDTNQEDLLTVDAQAVTNYNEAIAKASYEFIFADRKDALEKYVRLS